MRSYACHAIYFLGVKLKQGGSGCPPSCKHECSQDGVGKDSYAFKASSLLHVQQNKRGWEGLRGPRSPPLPPELQKHCKQCRISNFLSSGEINPLLQPESPLYNQNPPFNNAMFNIRIP